jgi:uncharacterized protein YcnI
VHQTLPGRLRHPDSRCSCPTGKPDWEPTQHCRVLWVSAAYGPIRTMHISPSPTLRTSGKRHAVVVAFTSVLLLLLLLPVGASKAQAHIAPKPTVVKAGAKLEVSFNVEHGCGTSPTTKLQMKVPAGVTASDPRGPSQMVATVSGSVVSFDGVVAGKNSKFFVTMQFPATPNVLSFPIVQTCKVGKVSWIQVPNAANPKPSFPAPQITVK